MKQKQVSNYEKLVEEWRLRFLEMDHEALVRRFGLEQDKEALYLTYFAHRIRISRRTGEVGDLTMGGQRPGVNTVLNFYNMFHYASEDPRASGELVPFRQVKRVYPFEAAYRKNILQTVERQFSGKADILGAACRKLGGTPMPQGDVGYVLPVLPGLQIALLFWDADEEFPAQANMLFDSCITEFMHEENVVTVAADAVYYLELAAGRP